MFKTTAIDTLKQDKKCQACWYIILSTMSGIQHLPNLLTVGLVMGGACGDYIDALPYIELNPSI